MCCETCYCFAVCQGARDEEAQACKAKEEITRLGKLALQLLRDGEGGGAYFSPELARAAYQAAGETLPEYLKPKADPASEANLKALKTWLR